MQVGWGKRRVAIALAAVGVAALILAGFSAATANVGLGVSKDLTGKQESISNPLPAGDQLGYFVNRRTEGPGIGGSNTIWFEADRFVLRPLDGGKERVVLRVPEGPSYSIDTVHSLQVENQDEAIAALALLNATLDQVGTGFILAGPTHYVDIASATLKAGPWSSFTLPVLATGCDAFAVDLAPGILGGLPAYVRFDLCVGSGPHAVDASGLGANATLVDATPAHLVWAGEDGRYVAVDRETGTSVELGRLAPKFGVDVLVEAAGDWVLLATTGPGSDTTLRGIALATGETAWERSMDLPTGTRLRTLASDGRAWTAVFHGGVPTENPDATKAGFLHGRAGHPPEDRYTVNENGFFESSIPSAVPHRGSIFYVKDVVLFEAQPGKLPAMVVPTAIAGAALVVAALVLLRRSRHRPDGKLGGGQGNRCTQCGTTRDLGLAFCTRCGAS